MRWTHALVALVAGCGSSSGGKPDAPAPDAPADARPDAAPIVMSGTVTDSNQAPIAQAQVCIVGHPEVPCATTATDGTWMLADLFEDDDLAISYTASGYLGLVSLSSKDNNVVVWFATAPLLPDNQAMQLLANQAGFTYPDTANGFFRIHVEGATGATVTLAPAGGHGPVYTKTDGTPDPSLTSTSTSASVVYFGNLAPGVYTLTATATGKTCYDRPQASPTQPIAGDWAPAGSGTARIEVVAGALTDDMHVYCF